MIIKKGNQVVQIYREGKNIIEVYKGERRTYSSIVEYLRVSPIVAWVSPEQIVELLIESNVTWTIN